MSETPVLPATDPDTLWGLWRDLVQEFGLRRLIWTLITSPSGWGFYGMDMASPLRATPMARGALARLATVATPEVERLSALAAINAERNDAMWRMAVLFYVSVPVTLFLAGLQGAPALVKEMFARQGLFLIPAILMLTGWLLIYFANHWRAKQIGAVINLALVERGVLPTPAGAGAPAARSARRG